MNSNRFTDQLIKWYQINKRDLPWRNTQDPYLIWLSEVILQQTRVNQGLPYYLKFVEHYPTVRDLAQASEDEVLRLWQGLGYYSRARNMLKAARYIMDQLNSEFPTSYMELLKLKGIGKYTAAAIASFAFHEKVPVVDGNVYRVLSRVFGVLEDISSLKGQKSFIFLAEKLLPLKNSNIFNQAIMEFGATVCTPKKPQCQSCSFNIFCYAHLKGKVSSLPYKSKKLVKKEREFTYFVIKHRNRLLMKRRKGKDIWEGLYEFYLKEGHSLNWEEMLPQDILSVVHKNYNYISPPLETFSHVLTHQIIKAQFWEIELKDASEIESHHADLKFYSFDEIGGLPKPILIIKYLNKNYF